MEHLATLLKDLGPWALTAIGGLLLRALRALRREIRALSETKMKANLAFEDLAKREPEYKRLYETWATNR